MLPYTVLYLPFSYTHLYVAIRGYTGSTSIPCYSNIWAIPSYVCLYTAIWTKLYTALYLPFSYTHLYHFIRGYTGSTSIPCYSNIWAIPSYVCLYTAIWIKLYTVLYLPFSYTCLDHPILVCSLYGSYAILLYTFPYTMRRYSSPIPSVVHTAL